MLILPVDESPPAVLNYSVSKDQRHVSERVVDATMVFLLWLRNNIVLQTFVSALSADVEKWLEGDVDDPLL